MPDDLHRLVYYSRNRVAGPGVDVAAEIRSILAVSRRNNAAAGLTGALMFNAGCFAQVLEGRRADIEAAFDRIQRDERHGDVSVLAFEAIAERQFGPWAMGFVGERRADAVAFADVAGNSDFDPAGATGHAILLQLRQLALEDEAEAA